MESQEKFAKEGILPYCNLCAILTNLDNSALNIFKTLYNMTTRSTELLAPYASQKDKPSLLKEKTY